MLKVEINGQQFEAEPGSTIIEVADSAGIYIPRFCYHEKLSVAANCRMCLVEVPGDRQGLSGASDGENHVFRSRTAAKKASASCSCG